MAVDKTCLSHSQPALMLRLFIPEWILSNVLQQLAVFLSNPAPIKLICGSIVLWASKVVFLLFLQVWKCEESLDRDLLLRGAAGREVYQVTAELVIQECSCYVRLSMLMWKPLCVYSPMLRMSFIVFSTQGNIVMKLTENRSDPSFCQDSVPLWLTCPLSVSLVLATHTWKFHPSQENLLGYSRLLRTILAVG